MGVYSDIIEKTKNLNVKNTSKINGLKRTIQILTIGTHFAVLRHGNIYDRIL